MHTVLYKYQNYMGKCFSSLLLKPDTDLPGRDLQKVGRGHSVIFGGGGNLCSQSLASADNEDIDLSKLPHRPSCYLLHCEPSQLICLAFNYYTPGITPTSLYILCIISQPAPEMGPISSPSFPKKEMEVHKVGYLCKATRMVSGGAGYQGSTSDLSSEPQSLPTPLLWISSWLRTCWSLLPLTRLHQGAHCSQQVRSPG